MTLEAIYTQNIKMHKEWKKKVSLTAIGGHRHLNANIAGGGKNSQQFMIYDGCGQFFHPPFNE